MRYRLACIVLAAYTTAACSPLWQGTLQGLRDSVKSPAAQLMAKAPPEAANLLYVESAGRVAIHVGVASPTHAKTIWWAAPDGVTLTLHEDRLLASEGLDGDLRDVRWLETPASWALETLPGARLVKQRDAFAGTVADTRYAYGFRLKPSRTSVWGPSQRDLTLVEEVLQEKPALGVTWPGDRYWVDASTGLVHRAEIYYRPDRLLVMVPKTPWPWQPASVAGLQRELAVNREADPLTLRFTLDGPLRLHQALAHLPVQDALVVRVLRRHDVAEQAANQAFLRASLQSVTQDVRFPGLAAWRDRLATLPSNGFMPIAAVNPVRLELMPTANPVLEKGDVLVLGHRQQHIMVWDVRLAQPCQQAYQPWLPITGYLRACLGNLVTPDYLWLAHPDGRVQKVAVAAWNAEPAPWPAPGTHIVSDNPALARSVAHPELLRDFAWALTRDFEGGRAP